MATFKPPFAYNTGGPIDGTSQYGDLVVGNVNVDYSSDYGGVKWWASPEETTGYIIGNARPGGQPTPITTNRVYLSPTYKGTDIQLSNNNQTASQLFGYQQSVLGVNPIGISDKVMFSVLCSLAAPATAPDSHFVGVGYTSMNYQGNPYDGFPGNDSQSLGYSSAGDIWLGGVNYGGGLQEWGNNDIIDIVIDNNTNLLWVRVNGGNWNNNPSANPATGSNGIVTIGGPFYPVLCPAYEGTMIIQNSPAYSVPSGYNFLATLANVGFFRTKGRTDQAFLDLANYIGAKNGQPPFVTTNDAEVWLENNGYYTSFNLPTPTPTATSQSTVTPTPTNTMTPTVTQTPTNTNTPTNTQTQTQTPTPSITASQTVTPTPSITASQTVTPTVTQTPTNTNTPSVTVTNTPTTTTTPTVTPTVNIVTSGLVIQLDAYNSSSYPGTGTTVYDITGGYNHTLIGATYTVINGIKCFDCTTGTNRVNYNATGPTLPNSGYTYITWARLMPSTVGFRTLLYTSGPPKITPITIPNGTSTLGYWATAFVSSTYDISSSASVWVQLAVVGTNTSQTFYLNGAQVGSTINEGAGGTRHWGWGNNDVSGQPWGHVANMYFYNRGLSLAEITQQYNYLAPRFVEPTPTPTTTSTPSVTPTQTLTPTTTTTPTPTQTPQFFLLFEDSSIATAENNNNIEIDII